RILEAYTAGVNSGLTALDDLPFEYILLRVEPVPWRLEDSILVLYAMYLDLQDENGTTDAVYAALRETSSPELFRFLSGRGTSWDAPVDGSVLDLPPLPAAEEIEQKVAESRDPIEAESDPIRGSNNFAVDSTVGSSGRAILAGDMHLGIGVPVIWYRASIVFPEEDGSERRVTGVTLPGTPAIVAGSNGEIAWTYTNSYGDWTDLVTLEQKSPDTYETPDGPRAIERVLEPIRIKGAKEETIETEQTIWGPVSERRGPDGVRRAIRWVGHDVQGANLNLTAMETASTLEEAMAVAHSAGMPAQNVLLAEKSGRIAWTIMGPVPRKAGASDWRLPHSWADGNVGWQGWLSPSEVPRIVEPSGGRLWTANARVVGGEDLEKIGDGGFAVGVRAAQIRDRLFDLEEAQERDLLAIQLEDRALFMERWQALLLEVLDDGAAGGNQARRETRRFVETWGAHAATGSVGYRVVRGFRSAVERKIFDSLTAGARERYPWFRWTRIAHREHPLWSIVSEKPPHLLPAGYESWDELLLETADELHAELTADGESLQSKTWGARNTTQFAHPLAGAVPLLGRYLKYPARQLPGDWDMPRVQDPRNGASQRMIVSPGDEERGIFHMPGGQSGHPLSPHFDDGHDAWAEGRPTPFLPGPAVTTLRLTPRR
ncbi:MAG TPA: penicillin acylase family protein, partial [Thermoanaerobaculia bacterium]|nr:penicillin acylase family protein [Thermoanaerobaculia bacterium]